MRERDARMALCCTVEPATIDITRQVQQQGADAIWQGLVQPSSRSRWARRAQAFDLADMQAATDRLRLRFIVPGDDEWPAALGDLSGCEPVNDMGGAPFGLWVRGAVPLAEASMKQRAGGPVDDPSDIEAGVWGGHIPMRRVAFAPVGDNDSRGAVPEDVRLRAEQFDGATEVGLDGV